MSRFKLRRSSEERNDTLNTTSEAREAAEVEPGGTLSPHRNEDTPDADPFAISLLRKILDRSDVEERFKRSVLQGYYKDRLPIADLQAHEVLLETAKEYVRQARPDLDAPTFTADFLEQNREELDRLIEETYLEMLLHERPITVSDLMDPAMLEAAQAYIRKNYPHLRLRSDFDVAPLQKQVLQEIQDLLNQHVYQREDIC